MSHGAARLLQELRGEIDDERVLSAMAAVPRELFVPRALRHRAWENRALPIGSGQTISQPLVVARMCALLELRGDERVLDVGTGSGYHAAVLARLARHIWSVERHGDLLAGATAALERAGARNVTLLIGDGTLGVPDEAPFDAINVAAAGPQENLTPLEAQLSTGGRLVAPVGGPEDQRLQVTLRTGPHFVRTWHEGVRFVPLVSPEHGV